MHHAPIPSGKTLLGPLICGDAPDGGRATFIGNSGGGVQAARARGLFNQGVTTCWWRGEISIFHHKVATSPTATYIADMLIGWFVTLSNKDVHYQICPVCSHCMLLSNKDVCYEIWLICSHNMFT